MGGAVRIIRADLTAAKLRAAAGREKDGSAARRMLALAMVLDERSPYWRRRPAAWIARPCVDWVHRYNAEGLRGLHDLKTPGPKPKAYSASTQAELAKLR